MRVCDFSKVFHHFPMVDDTTVHHLEATFLDPTWGFLWDVSQRNVKVMGEFVENITEYDFGLEEGEVRSILTSLGTRMIAIGTSLGNVVLHERQRYRRVEEREEDGNGPVIVIGYYPEPLQDLLGTRSVKDDQFYRYTGFFNAKDNIGHNLKQFIKHLNQTA